MAPVKKDVTVVTGMVRRGSLAMGKTSETNAKRRWYQFHLWHLFALAAVVAIGCSWFACRMAAAQRQNEAVELIRGRQGEVYYDYEFDARRRRIPNAKPPGMRWFRNLVGEDFVSDVVEVDCYPVHLLPPNQRCWLPPRITDDELKCCRHLHALERLDLTSSPVSDAGLEHLKGLGNLEVLCLCYTRVGNAGLEHIGGLTNLEELWLVRTRISDAGLIHLQGLTNLRELWLSFTKVTDEGVAQLQEALPNCEIHR